MDKRNELNELAHRCFKWQGRDYKVTGTQYVAGRYTVITDRRTFSYDVNQFNVFLTEITVLPLDAKPEAKGFVPDKNKITFKTNPAMNETQIANVDASVTAAESMTTEMMKMFKTLSGTPTDSDFKKAEAMSKVAGTVISIVQTQINLEKLKLQK
jgi:hypothetical protein